MSAERFRIRLRQTLSLVLPAVALTTAGGTIIHVPADQPTIQQAINVANNNDTILIAPGMYLENINYQGKAIMVQGGGSVPEDTIIDGNNQGPVVTMENHEGPQSVLTNVTIQGGFFSFGAGMKLLGASPTVVGNVFRYNSEGGGGFGAGIGGNSSSAIIRNNTFYDNSCDSQFLSGVVSFVNTSSPHITNNIIRDNPCRGIQMTLPTGNHPVVANNTVLRNHFGIRVDARVDVSQHLYANNIVVGNGIGLLVEFGSQNNKPPWLNNLVFANSVDYSGIGSQTGTNGNISADPLLFTEAWPRPAANSPTVDAGTLSVPNLPVTDFSGRPRAYDGNNDQLALPDIGAYEFIFGDAPADWIGNIQHSADHGATNFIFYSRVGQTYRIEQASNLESPTTWLVIKDGIVGVDGDLAFRVGNTLSAQHAFYRVVSY